jgi:CheY-like chemotaxis protein
MTVLIIDDEPFVLKAFKRWLESKGKNVITAINGGKGLERAKDDKPDAILLDILMPGMDGKEVLRRLKVDPVTAPIPVIMLTVKNTANDVIDTVKNIGAVDYVIKTWAFLTSTGKLNDSSNPRG